MFAEKNGSTIFPYRFRGRPDEAAIDLFERLRQKSPPKQSFDVDTLGSNDHVVADQSTHALAT